MLIVIFSVRWLRSAFFLFCFVLWIAMVWRGKTSQKKCSYTYIWTKSYKIEKNKIRKKVFYSTISTLPLFFGYFVIVHVILEFFVFVLLLLLLSLTLFWMTSHSFSLYYYVSMMTIILHNDNDDYVYNRHSCQR